MLAIALELASHDPAYEDVASKFWEHFLYIAHAMSGGRLHGGHGPRLWDDEDGFFYDVLHMPDDRPDAAEGPLAGRPDSAARGADARAGDARRGTTGFRRRMDWFVDHRPDLTGNVACMRTAGMR